MDDELVDADFEMTREEPGRRAPVSLTAIEANIERVRKGATGKWYRIGRWTGNNTANGLASRLRKRPEYAALEFYSERITDDPPWRCKLFCRWAGVAHQPGATAEQVRPPKLAVVQDASIVEEELPPASNEEPHRNLS